MRLTRLSCIVATSHLAPITTSRKNFFKFARLSFTSMPRLIRLSYDGFITQLSLYLDNAITGRFAKVLVRSTVAPPKKCCLNKNPRSAAEEDDALQSPADVPDNNTMDLSEDYVDVEDPQPPRDTPENKQDTRRSSETPSL
jgi:hypothetical protein